jgi:type IV pilus assembly protein PilV
MNKQLSTYGFSLIEVLIATFILTVGLLGIAGLYINSLKRTENAYWHTLATSQMIILAEQLKAGTIDYSTWSKECGKLLPHGECKYEDGKITICWDKNGIKRCL